MSFQHRVVQGLGATKRMHPSPWLSHILFAITLLVLGTQAASADASCTQSKGQWKCSCSGTWDNNKQVFDYSSLGDSQAKPFLSPQTAPDLEVAGLCSVPLNQTYYFRNVNIIRSTQQNPGGGTSRSVLLFRESDAPHSRSTTHFWASAIIIENDGELYAYGSESGEPFGANWGALIFHLYGKNKALDPKTRQFVGQNQGALCKSPLGTPTASGKTPAPCGIPQDVWESNGAREKDFPGLDVEGKPVRDYFYQYEPLHADGRCSDISTGAAGSVWSAKSGCEKTTEQVGYFGNKVLAVSYRGKLELSGKKGATYGSLDPKASGRSWTRLNGTITPGMTSLNVADPLDGDVGDLIVVTTTDYVPNHSELGICSVSGNTITFTADLTGCPDTKKGVQWTHNGQQFPLDRLPDRLNIKDRLNNKKKAAETRAAVALLTRSIRIVSEDDVVGQTFRRQLLHLGDDLIQHRGLSTELSRRRYRRW